MARSAGGAALIPTKDCRIRRSDRAHLRSARACSPPASPLTSLDGGRGPVLRAGDSLRSRETYVPRDLFASPWSAREASPGSLTRMLAVPGLTPEVPSTWAKSRACAVRSSRRVESARRKSVPYPLLNRAPGPVSHDEVRDPADFAPLEYREQRGRAESWCQVELTPRTIALAGVLARRTCPDLGDNGAQDLSPVGPADSSHPAIAGTSEDSTLADRLSAGESMSLRPMAGKYSPRCPPARTAAARVAEGGRVSCQGGVPPRVGRTAE